MGHLVLIAGIVLSGCGDGTDFPPVPRIGDLPADATILTVGIDNPETLLTRVRDAGISRDGRTIAIADAADPFLVLVDRVTGAELRVGAEGGGPGELTGVLSLGFTESNEVAVMSPGQRIDRFEITGEWIDGWPVHSLGLSVSSARPGCGGDLVALAVPRDHRERDLSPWLHRLSLGPDSELVSSGLFMEGIGYRYTFGDTKWDVEQGRLLFLQTMGGREGAFLVDCTRMESDTVAMPLSPTVEAGGTSLTLPEEIATGAVLLPDGIVLTHWRGAGEQRTTRVLLVRSLECRAVDLAGRWEIHDFRNGEALLSHLSPVPHILLVSWDEVESKMVPTECPASVQLLVADH